MVIHMESNIIQSVMASSAWHCGVKEPIMLDIMVNYSTGESLSLLGSKYVTPTRRWRWADEW